MIQPNFHRLYLLSFFFDLLLASSKLVLNHSLDYVVLEDGVIDILSDSALEFKIGVILVNIDYLLVDAFGTLLGAIGLLLDILFEFVLRDVYKV